MSEGASARAGRTPAKAGKGSGCADHAKTQRNRCEGWLHNWSRLGILRGSEPIAYHNRGSRKAPRKWKLWRRAASLMAGYVGHSGNGRVQRACARCSRGHYRLGSPCPECAHDGRPARLAARSWRGAGQPDQTPEKQPPKRRRSRALEKLGIGSSPRLPRRVAVAWRHGLRRDCSQAARCGADFLTAPERTWLTSARRAISCSWGTRFNWRAAR